MTKKYRPSSFLSFLTILPLLYACSRVEIDYKYPEKVKGEYRMPTERTEKLKEETIFQKETLTLRFNEEKTQDLKSNNQNREEERFTSDSSYIKPETLILPSQWNDVLARLSEYPLEMVQDKLLMTEWFFEPQNDTLQYKINAVLTDKEVKITVLCRKKDKKSGWINQKNDATLADKIKTDIISAR